jgi:uncharacterized protein (DUF433 family)
MLSLGALRAHRPGTPFGQVIRTFFCPAERIVIAPDLHHGDPCIKGTRIPVAMIVGSLADGMTSAQIRKAYPQLADEDIRAALAYAAELTHEELLVPLPA